MRETQPERARELWTRALELGGEQHQVLHGLGELLVAHEAFADALPLLERAGAARSGGWRVAMLRSRSLAALGDFEAAERALEEGRSDLQPGRPAQLFQPENDLTVEHVYLCLQWALSLASGGQHAAAREQEARARDLIASLPEHDLFAEYVLDLESLTLRLEQELGERDAQDCVPLLRAQYVACLRHSGGEVSPFIAVNLSSALMRLDEPPLDEAEALLLIARSSKEIEVRKDAENQLARLASLRNPGNHEEKR
jgi:hypothetical protein